MWEDSATLGVAKSNKTAAAPFYLSSLPARNVKHATTTTSFVNCLRNQKVASQLHIVEFAFAREGNRE